VDERTRQHLLTAEENRSLARALLTGGDAPSVHLRWGIVIAFYASMHCINAFL
jgi:hypothetical protein